MSLQAQVSQGDGSKADSWAGLGLERGSGANSASHRAGSMFWGHHSWDRQAVSPGTPLPGLALTHIYCGQATQPGD